MRVPLHDVHAAAGARFVEFSGFQMPLQYSSIVREHLAVRRAAGLFDVSHMSNLVVEGQGASATLSRALSADITKLAVGRAKYAVALRADATILDDLIVYRIGADRFHVIANAGQNEAVARALDAGAHDATIEDLSREFAILAVQGPASRGIPEAMFKDVGTMKPFRCRSLNPEDPATGFVAGTGYTGEPGIEIVVPNDAATDVWNRLLTAGAASGLVACGLGARDTLRLEKGYCLASHEFEGGRSPLEAGLAWTVDWDHEFVGKEALAAQRAKGTFERLVGLILDERGIARQGNVVRHDGTDVGTVTSGTMSPSLRRAIALAYVGPSHAKTGTTMEVVVRARALRATVTKTPFV